MQLYVYKARAQKSPFREITLPIERVLFCPVAASLAAACMHLPLFHHHFANGHVCPFFVVVCLCRSRLSRLFLLVSSGKPTICTFINQSFFLFLRMYPNSNTFLLPLVLTILSVICTASLYHDSSQGKPLHI